MAENRIQIMLEMIDNASPEFKRMNSETISQVKQLEQQANTSFDKVEQASKKADNGFKKLSKSVSDLRLHMLGVTFAFAIMVKGLNDAARYNTEAAKTSDAFKKSLTGLSATLGQTFAPAIQGLTVAIDAFRVVIVSALGGFIKLFSFTFEFLAQMPAAFGNIIDNIKARFTGDDPIGIVQGFQNSFQRAVEVAEIATDQILQNFEETRQNIETGNTLDKQQESLEKFHAAISKGADSFDKAEDKKRQAQKETEASVVQGLATVSEEIKAAAVVVKAIRIKESIMQTASGVSKALGAYPPPFNFIWAALVGAAGAAQTAAIAGVGFAKGTDSVPAMLTPGEMVVPRDFASAIRSGDLSLSGGGRGGSSFGDVNIFIQGGISPGGSSINEMAEQLGFAFEKEVRLARGF